MVSFLNFHLILCRQLAFCVELHAHVSCRWKHFIAEILSQLLLGPISNESAKGLKKPLVTGSNNLSPRDIVKTTQVALLKQSPSSPFPALSLSVWPQTWTGFRSRRACVTEDSKCGVQGSHCLASWGLDLWAQGP